MNLVKMFKSGQFYLQICPNDKSLAHTFPEIKIINAIKLAKKYLPPLVVGLFVWQYYLHAELAITLITALFALSLPLQGILWLGKRANSPLPLNLISWYNHIKNQLIAKNILPEKNSQTRHLNFIEFVTLLNLAKLHLGSYSGYQDDESDAQP